MDNLPRVIGKAPSELSPLEFRDRLKGERDRVRREIELFQRKNVPKSQVAKAAKAARSALDTVLKEKNITPERLQEMIRAHSQGKK